MEAIKEYIITFCIVAMICSILMKLVGEKGSIATLMKLLCGLFILFTALSPIVNLPLYEVTNYFDLLSIDAEYISATGMAATQEEIMCMVKKEAQDHISRKGASLGAMLEIDILIEDYLPKEITLSGAASPYSRKILSEYIEEQLGIPLEDQIWIS